MPNILLKRSLTSGSLPTTASLTEGELAMNVPDGRIFLRKSGSGTDTIESVITTGAKNSGNVQLTGSMSISGSGDVLTAQGDNIYFTGNLMEFSGDVFEMTGSLTVVGATTLSGSLKLSGSLTTTQGITGSVFGTSSYSLNGLSSSYALNSNSASYSISSSYAVTSSYTLNGLSSSYSLNATSASYALTASYWSGSVESATSASYALTASYATNALTLTQVTGVTLPSSSWSLSGGYYQYVYSNEIITSTSVVDVIPDNSSVSVIRTADVLPRTDSATGQVTLYSTNAPSSSMTVTFNILK